MSAPPDIVPRTELARLIARDAALRESLLSWAMSHTRHPQNAEDLFSDTLARALDPAFAGWDRAHYATAGAFLGSVMNGLARNRLRSSYMAAARSSMSTIRRPSTRRRTIPSGSC